MGCTSSAPNTLSANASKEDKSIQFEENTEETYSKHIDVVSIESEQRTEMKELPPSDTTESVQLVRNNKSTTSLEPEKDLDTSEHTILEKESSDTNETTNEEDVERDDKISKLKLEVLEKFIGVSVTQDTNHDKEIPNSTDEVTDLTEKDGAETDAKAEIEINLTDEEHTDNLEEPEEASPSQSQSSRATRWEALADIAAELPPSLAVDPITGQIYSLSK